MWDGCIGIINTATKESSISNRHAAALLPPKVRKKLCSANFRRGHWQIKAAPLSKRAPLPQRQLSTRALLRIGCGGQKSGHPNMGCPIGKWNGLKPAVLISPIAVDSKRLSQNLAINACSRGDAVAMALWLCCQHWPSFSVALG